MDYSQFFYWVKGMFDSKPTLTPSDILKIRNAINEMGNFAPVALEKTWCQQPHPKPPMTTEEFRTLMESLQRPTPQWGPWMGGGTQV